MGGKRFCALRMPGAGLWIALTLAFLAAIAVVAQSNIFDLPPLPKPASYGNVLIDRLAGTEGSKAVGFSHWSHRTRYSCRVCHFELDFVMLANASEITEEANRNGRFCGACHDGQIAFGHTDEHCSKCHTGSSKGNAKQFKKLRKLPRASFGNKIDWVEAEDSGMVTPIASILEPDFEPFPFKEEFEVKAAWILVPPADFSHNSHLRWLDCSNCHPDLFKIEQEATENLLMKNILQGQFCGACHLTVAFPIQDCKRCHTKMRG